LANKIGEIGNKNILFLQGPMGSFFKKLDYNFRQMGAKTYRIGFNMGDWIFSYHDNYTPFAGRPEEWPAFIEQFLLEKKIDKIFLFGDCRYYQRIARKIAYEHDIEVYVFEEGYLRPHFITLEKFGVNGFSHLPREADFYRKLSLKEYQPPQHAHASKTKMILSAILYYAISNLFKFRYPHYRHHREFSAIKEAFYGIRGLARKGIYHLSEKHYLPLIETKLSKQYYFVPLQTHNDFQVLQHSNYRSIEKFIIEILESFARHAPKETYIVFKHHPVDRGRKNYKHFIKEQAQLLDVEGRVLVFHDVYLPSCITHAKATITINSTVGLTSVGYGIPTKVMGNAVYDIVGLTNKETSLKKFWHSHQKPDMSLYARFRQYLIENTQLNGSFYGRMPKELQYESK